MKTLINTLSKLLCVILIASMAQVNLSAKDDLSVTVGGGGGYMLNALGIYDNLIDTKTYGLAYAEVGFNSSKENDYFSWVFNNPTGSLGFAWSGTGLMQFKNGSRLGNLYTIYGGFQADLYKGEVFGVGPFVNLGFTYTPYKYDAVTNPQNLYVGSHIVALFGLGLDFHFRAGEHFVPGFRIGYSHHSNGMLRVPNFGLNKIEANVYLRYDIEGKGAVPAKCERPEFKKWNWDVYFSGGVHSCDVERGVNESLPDDKKWEHSHPWARLNLGATCNYRYHPIFSTGVGVDLFYTENARRLEECEKVLSGNDVVLCPFYCGAYIQQNFHYKNVVASFGIGVYLYKNLGPEDSKWNYQRAAIRYYMPKLGNVFVGFAMRAHSFDRSDTWEFTIGKRF